MLDAVPTVKLRPSKVLKAALLTVASVYLGYGIYWAINGFIWAKNVMQIYGFVISGQNIGGLAQLSGAQATMLLVQESCSAANSFVLLAGTIFAFAAAVYYLKNNPRWLLCMRFTIVLTAVFAILLIPASLHHLVGAALGWPMTIVYVGLSYLLQALFVAPPLLILNKKLSYQYEPLQIRKWIAIAGPLFMFALWFKYLMLWLDTLLPMGTAPLNGWAMLGAVNSLATLLSAGAVTAYTAIKLVRQSTVNLKLVGTVLVLGGLFFLVDSLVSLKVSIYTSFWYLTDFWMLTAIVLGVAVLTFKPQR